ncbi:MAG: hypothetical protein LAE24_00935 [Candidatus Contendobacter sp.]|nr:hypothetical protein [Candidatus Contendobacter sp.]
MNEARLRVLLDQVRSGQLAVEQAIDQLRELPFRDLGEAMLDSCPEVIYCAGKTVAQVQTIVAAMRPVIAVPTSIGYGARFSGLAALLEMFTSCAGGVGVINIDNGFGAACLASMINHL